MPKFAGHIAKLKDGSECAIREAQAADAQQLIDLANHLFENGEGQVLVPGELKLTMEAELKFIEDMNANPNSFLAVAEVDSEIAGIIDFNPKKRKRVAHTGEFGLGIAAPYRGLGIGRLLMQEMLAWARRHPALEKVNLRVLSRNHAAIQLYDSLGFKREGLLSAEVKFEDGTYADDVLMALRVKA